MPQAPQTIRRDHLRQRLRKPSVWRTIQQRIRTKEGTRTGDQEKFSFNEQREYDTIEDDIAAKEAEITQIEADINGSVSDFIKLNELTEKRAKLEEELDHLLDRYIYLTELAESFDR